MSKAQTSVCGEKTMISYENHGIYEGYPLMSLSEARRGREFFWIF